MQMKFSLLLSVVIFAAAVTAQHCNMPQPSRRCLTHGVNLRKHRLEKITIGDEPREYYAILELYHEKKAYVTNLKTKECKSEELTHDFHRHDIRTGSKFGGYKTLGFGVDAVTLGQWFSEFHDEHGHLVHQYQTFTQKECVPVRDDRHSTEHGLVYEQFSDTTLGFHDPNIWTIPPNCH